MLVDETEDCGRPKHLHDYQQWQQRDQDNVIKATNLLVRLFSNNNPVLGHGRSAGLIALDLIPPAKHWLAKKSMGLGKKQPRLARGYCTMSQHYDVIVVGAGMVGTTLAVALSTEQNLKIALIEPFELKPIADNDPADLRVSAISQASEQLLKNLNIWSHLIPGRLSPFTDMTVWETQSSQIHFDSADVGESHLGHLIENRHIQQACLNSLPTTE